MDVGMPRTPLRYGLVLAVLPVIGCGQEDSLTPVHGRISFHGQVVPGGTIVFVPDLERGCRGLLACGEIDAEGRYSLHTGDKAGAVCGWYRITIAGPPRVELPRKYSNPAQSGLLREVRPDKNSEQDFYLE
jgi:hypothetical protein